MKDYNAQFKKAKLTSIERRKLIINLSKSNPTLYFDQILNSSSEFVDTINKIYEICKLTSEQTKRHYLFKQKFGSVLSDLIRDNISVIKGTNYHPFCLNGDYPKLFNYCAEFIDDISTNEIIDCFLECDANFSSVGKKAIASVTSKYIDVSDGIRALNILKIFYRNITPQDFGVLIKKIPHGINNPYVKEILKSTKLFEYLKFDENKFQTDQSSRKELVCAIAKTPTLIKRLPFKVTLSLNDLKFIAPVMRFKFVQYVYRYEISYAHGYWTGDRFKQYIVERKFRAHEEQLSIERIELEDMKELLFAISLQKNEEYVRWLKAYEAYLQCLDGCFKKKGLKRK